VGKYCYVASARRRATGEERGGAQVVRWAVRKGSVKEWLVNAFMAMYEGTQTVVRTAKGVDKSFDMKMELHQGSICKPVLFDSHLS